MNGLKFGVKEFASPRETWETDPYGGSSMIRYGILGFGHHGVLRLAPAFAHTRQSLLSGIWRRDPAKARQNATQFGFKNVYQTAEDLCASPEVDAVLVASPDALHLEHTLLAFQHEKPVLCEKPLAMNAREAEQMLHAAREAGVAFGVAHNFRFNRSVERMRERVREGLIGPPVFATAHFCFESEKSPRAWIYDPALACGGPIGDVGIHAIDALRFVLGQEITAVTTLARRDGASGGVEASAALSLEFSEGALGSVQVSFRARYHTLVEVVGQAGVLRCESAFNVERPVELVHIVHGVQQSAESCSNADSYSRMLDAFAVAARGEGDFVASGADAVNNQRVLDAAYQSWRTGRSQPIR